MAEKNLNKQYREKRRFWRVHIKAWSKSGLTQAEYCRQHDLRKNRLIYWKKKFAKNSTPSVKEKSSFVAVPAVTSSAMRCLENRQTDPGVKIQLGNIAITLTENFNPDVLARVVHTLGGRA